jgi:plasmid maintenance system antidote protein VapI
MGNDLRYIIWDNGMTLAEVARKVGRTETYAHRLLSGKLNITHQMARRFEVATNGALTAGMILGFAPLPPHSASSDKSAA